MYYLMDILFDPIPQEIRKKLNHTGKMLYYQTQEVSYRRYKNRCYRHLLIEAAICLALGLLYGFLIKVL